MPTALYRIAMNVVIAACLVLLFLIVTSKSPPDFSFLTGDAMQNFKTLFLSIILEALPFVLLGVAVSAVLQSFVSERTIQRLIPRSPILGVLFACLMGIIFPLCECGMIPVVRRLMRKGMPVYIAVVFILVGPILNPVVYASTYMAFRTRPEMAYARMGLAFAIALIVGLLLARVLRGAGVVRGGALPAHADSHGHGAEHVHTHGHDHGGAQAHHHRSVHEHEHAHPHEHEHAHGHDHDHDHAHGGKLSSLLSHASEEFFEMGKYLIFGAMLTALIQTFVAREALVSIGQGPVVSNLFMMGFAYVLSLCSTSDAFVASSFATTFSAGSLLAFLVFGPMFDIKSTLMLLSVSKRASSPCWPCLRPCSFWPDRCLPD
ncbi:permease [Gordoniibacillus kamchatkensis]|uniref:permease n=1 Tax=Gordoniibacillus kamchatkensis TaxID=1590651 RepID=UPI000A49E04F